MSQLVHLKVVTPKAVIPGTGEYYVDAGSTMSLECFIYEVSQIRVVCVFHFFLWLLFGYWLVHVVFECRSNSSFMIKEFEDIFDDLWKMELIN